MAAALRSYLLANVAFLVPSGLVGIIFPWLLVVALQEPPERVGIAKMIVQLPALLFCRPSDTPLKTVHIHCLPRAG